MGFSILRWYFLTLNARGLQQIFPITILSTWTAYRLENLLTVQPPLSCDTRALLPLFRGRLI